MTQLGMCNPDHIVRFQGIFNCSQETPALQRFCRGYVQYIVPSNKGISILIRDTAVDMFFCLFQCDIHVAIKTREHTSIVDPRDESYHDSLSDNSFQEVGG